MSAPVAGTLVVAGSESGVTASPQDGQLVADAGKSTAQ
jgi:hypothetical protein